MFANSSKSSLLMHFFKTLITFISSCFLQWPPKKDGEWKYQNYKSTRVDDSSKKCFYAKPYDFHHGAF